MICRTLLIFKSLSSSPDLREQYAVSVNNRFSKLCDENMEDSTSQTAYDCLVQSCTEVGRVMLPKTPKKKWTNMSKSENVVNAREKVAQAKCNGSPSDVLEAKQALQLEYKISEKLYIEQQARIIENASFSSRHALAWKVVNEVTGRKESKMTGKANGTAEERKSKWYDHFSSLLGKPPSVPDDNFIVTPVVDHELQIETGPFTCDELNKAIKAARRGGAVGVDSIPLEIWESKEFLPYLLDLCNKGIIDHIKPISMVTIIYCTNPQKGRHI